MDAVARTNSVNAIVTVLTTSPNGSEMLNGQAYRLSGASSWDKIEYGREHENGDPSGTRCPPGSLGGCQSQSCSFKCKNR